MIPHSKPWIDDEDLDAVQAQLRSGLIAQGRRTAEFESAVADCLGLAGAVATASGTAALRLCLEALDIGSGDEVVLPTYVCRSVLDAVSGAGAVPRLCDVGPCWTVTPASVEPHLTARTKAILVVHIFGIAVETSEFLAFGIPVIEDFCQAFGLPKVGSSAAPVGDLGFFSFHATKCLSTGEGGAATAREPDLLRRMRALRSGIRPASPMSDLQAALGLSQLARYDEMLRRRKAIATRFIENLPAQATAAVAGVGHRSMFFRFPLRSDRPFEAVHAGFSEHRVSVRKGVDALLHRSLGLPDGRFPTATELFESTISIPIYPALTDEDLETIVRAANAVFSVPASVAC